MRWITRYSPEGWLAALPGQRLTSALLRIERMGSNSEMARDIADWFVPESVAASQVLDDAAIIAGDFRIDPAGHLRLRSSCEGWAAPGGADCPTAL